MAVTIYTTSSCPWCQKAKEFLKTKKVKYQEIDVSSDKKGLRDMVKMSGQMGVPVLDINKKIIIGFDPEAIVKALAK